MLGTYSSFPVKLKRIVCISGVVSALSLLYFNSNESSLLDIDDHAVKPYNYDFKLVFPTTVPEITKTKDLFLVILVNSAARGAEYRARRNSIRQYWANRTSCENLKAISNDKLKKHEWILVFMLGKAGPETNDDMLNAKEAEQHNDMLIGNINDHYINNTIKVYMGLFWLSKTQLNAKYIFKTDDDVYVRIPGIIDYLVAKNLPTRFYGGRLRVNSTVHRSAEGIWSVSRTYFDKYFWPPFATGAFIIFSNDLLPDLLNHVNIRRPFHTDDTYISVVMEDLEVTATEISSFIVERDIPQRMQKLDTCNFLSFNAIGHDIHPGLMKIIHDRLAGLCRDGMTTINHSCPTRPTAAFRFLTHSVIAKIFKYLMW